MLNNSFSILVHNQKLAKDAEKILKSLVNNNHSYLYLVLEDGTRIKITDKAKLEYYEIIPMEIQ